MFQTISTYIKLHEKLLIVALGILASLYLGNRYIDRVALNTEIKQATLQKQLDDARKNSADFALQVAKDKAEYALEKAEYQSHIDSLIASIASRDKAVTDKTKKVLDPKPAFDVITDLSSAYSGTMQLESTTITEDGKLAFPLPTVQRFTVTKLERDNLAADLSDQIAVTANTKSQLDGALYLNSQMTKQVDGLNIQIADEKKTCDARVNTQKAEARKSKRNWFVAGAVVAVIVEVAVKIGLGR